MHASHKVFVCYKLRFMLIHGNPRAEQTEPRIRSARFGIGRDETEHRPTLLGRTEIETEHPLAPRDESEQYSISVRSVRSQACMRYDSPPNSSRWSVIHIEVQRVPHKLYHC